MIAVEKAIQEHLSKIEQEHAVTVIAAIESGSRAWGFPSPDSDFDVRFIYAHAKDWYIQLSPERDVIEVPINPVLDISGGEVKLKRFFYFARATLSAECLAFVMDIFERFTDADKERLAAKRRSIENEDLRYLLDKV